MLVVYSIPFDCTNDNTWSRDRGGTQTSTVLLRTGSVQKSSCNEKKTLLRTLVSREVLAGTGFLLCIFCRVRFGGGAEMEDFDKSL